MTLYGRGRHRWKRDEIAKGIWMSLGLKTSDGVVEVTPRKFFAFNMTNGTAVAKPRQFDFTKPAEFDKLVVSRKPAGPVADVLHNGAVQKCGPNFPVMVYGYWNEYETWGGEID